VGIQSFNEEVCRLISRRQDTRKLEDNLTFLRGQTGVHIHADLIVGLPGETLESFAAGFDRLVRLDSQEIQVGILKRLRGTPITRHDDAWAMRYHPHPPYEILQNKLLDFLTVQRLRRFAKYWDLVGNSGNFVETTPLLWNVPPASCRQSEFSASQPENVGQASSLTVREACLPRISSGRMPPEPADKMSALHFQTDSNPGHSAGETPATRSPFAAFLRWSDWLFAKIHRTDGIALARLAELLFRFLTEELGRDVRVVAGTMWRDYQRGGRRDKPEFLRAFTDDDNAGSVQPKARVPKRQARHLAIGKS
jgi:hypothetical protein